MIKTKIKCPDIKCPNNPRIYNGNCFALKNTNEDVGFWIGFQCSVCPDCPISWVISAAASKTQEMLDPLVEKSIIDNKRCFEMII